MNHGLTFACTDTSNSSFVRLDIWDIPGQVDFFDQVSDFKNVFGGWGALVFVIDAQVRPSLFAGVECEAEFSCPSSNNSSGVF